MAGDKRVELEMLPTGVPGLDEILGGGIPRLSFNVVVGGPGSGKSTLALQIAFANATPERPALFFTVLGEPTVKLLRYQQQFDFFDVDRVGTDIHVLNLSEEIIRARGDLEPVLARIQAEVAALKPGVVVIDSFRSIPRTSMSTPHPDVPDAIGFERFMQLLAHQLTTWDVTAFLIGEYDETDLADPLFTVADGILCLKQKVDRSSCMRWIQALKQRGVPVMAGLHTMRITGAGVRVFPRLAPRRRTDRPRLATRLSTGMPEVDAMMGGGAVPGDSIVVTGPSGVGKTAFAIEFLAAADRRGESAVVVVFEEDQPAFLARSESLDRGLSAMHLAGRLEFVALGPLDLSVDETLHQIGEAIRRIDAKCVVVDSLSGFELALAPSFREDFRESMYRLVRSLTATGVTVLLTVEIVEAGFEVRGPTRQLSFLADDILQLRYIELQGEVRAAFNVLKMRKSRHSHMVREYEITSSGVRLGRTLREYDNILGRSPERHEGPSPGMPSGLSDQEGEILQRLIRGDRMTAAELALDIALPPDVIRAALARMADLDLAERDGDTFRALAQPVPR